MREIYEIQKVQIWHKFKHFKKFQDDCIILSNLMRAIVHPRWHAYTLDVARQKAIVIATCSVKKC